MTRRNRGRTNRGIGTQARAGLGTRRVQRRLGGVTRAPMEPRAMGSTMTNGTRDPTNILSTIKVQHRTQLELASIPTAGLAITPATIIARTPGLAAAWARLRLLKVDMWGLDTSSVSLRFDGSGFDGAQFTDWGTPGNQRAQIHAVPDFASRATWFSTGSTTTLFTVLTDSTASTTSIILNVTLELQTITGPTFFSSSLSDPLRDEGVGASPLAEIRKGMSALALA
jgi:hypothetical protein